MPITSVDASSALVVIDLQKGIVAVPRAHPVSEIVKNAVALIDAFRNKARPVVLVHVGFSPDLGDAIKTRNQGSPMGKHPDDFSEYIDELRVDVKRDVLIKKRQWGAFYGTDLDLQLRRRSISNIVLCGIATSAGVESTARDAYERDYNLTFASDAMTDSSAAAHERAVELIFPRLGEVGTTEEILAKL